MASNKKPLFHACTITHNGRARRIIAKLKLTKAYDTAKPPNPLPPTHEAVALWDTGATNTFITRAIVEAMGLIPVGRTAIRHGGGEGEGDTFMVNIILPNNVRMQGIPVTECQQIVDDFEVIIGMDIIGLGDFAVTNVSGKTVMTFRIPSIETIDYVEEANQITAADERAQYVGVGRNDPCPCGKKDHQGRPLKFKHCHGTK